MTKVKFLLAWENIVLFLICVTDMCTTLFWVHNHTATEANPLMNYWLQLGDGAFCAAKIMSFLPFLFLCAYYRPQRPQFVTGALRVTIALYTLTYVYSVASQFIHFS